GRAPRAVPAGRAVLGAVTMLPLPTEQDTVAVPQPSAGRCSEECEADSQCPWGQRCTRTSCSRVCMDAPGGEAQAGACPMPGGGGTCLDLCSLDEECPWGHKCCSNGCGHVCMRVALTPSDSPAQFWFPFTALPLVPRAHSSAPTCPQPHTPADSP
uniref:Uncharacterized protein n=1 Tax=Geospiza parvula TaxID=87175 RepID=A0A8U8B9W4_GEOPR